jgi:type IV pilus assembly protein PilY1
VVIDFDLEENYKADVVYFGTVSGDWENGWSGSVERLKIREKVDGVQQMVRPSGWELKPLIDTDQPITAAPAVGTDGDNYWVYFGTGRFLHVKDKTDPQQHTYYGIKEPRNSAGDFTWLPVEKKDVTPDTHCSAAPGSQGLLRVDQILVQEAGCADLAALSCINDLTASCLPKKPPAYVESISNFAELVDYIVCEDCSEADSTGTDGWYLNFYDERERNLGQAALLGGIVTFTTYQPFDDDCLSEGLGYIYAVYYQTGTAWYESVYGDDGTDEFGNVITRKAIGRGLVGSPNLHVGTGEGTKAFVQTSTGAIVEIPEPNLPYKNIKTGKVSWEEVIRNTAGETAEPEE